MQELPAIGQIFTVGSITWEISPSGEGVIISKMSIAVTRSAAPQWAVASILELPLETLGPLTLRGDRWPVSQQPRRNISVDDLIASLDRTDERIQSCLTLTESVRRPTKQADQPLSHDGHLDLVITSTSKERTVVARPVLSTREVSHVLL